MKRRVVLVGWPRSRRSKRPTLHLATFLQTALHIHLGNTYTKVTWSHQHAQLSILHLHHMLYCFTNKSIIYICLFTMCTECALIFSFFLSFIFFFSFSFFVPMLPPISTSGCSFFEYKWYRLSRTSIASFFPMEHFFSTFVRTLSEAHSSFENVTPIPFYTCSVFPGVEYIPNL